MQRGIVMGTRSFSEEVERLGIPLATVKTNLVKVLGDLLGESPRDATVYHIKLNECGSAEQVAERLTLIFGEGSTMLLDATLQECKLCKSKASGVGKTKSSTRSSPRRRRAKP